MDDTGYINFYEILGLEPNANPGEVRKTYRRKMKGLVGEIAQAKITEDRRAEYILEMAKLNGAVYVLRDKAMREEYEAERDALIDLEREWRELAEKDSDPEKTDPLRREFDGRVRAFLSKYVEETMLEAGQDKEVAEASNWNILHSRYALKHLRHYRHRLYHDILERLPYHQVTKPSIDWDERKMTVAGMLEESV
jgi:curved DNA-binding protein CbpA